MIKNSVIKGGAKLTIAVDGETIISNSFEVKIGSELEIK
jgi:hypothetical protein